VTHEVSDGSSESTWANVEGNNPFEVTRRKFAYDPQPAASGFYARE
jgi:hypothetical protein